MKIFITILLIAIGIAAMWWLSRFDPGVDDENKLKSYSRRSARCLGTILLILIFYKPNAVKVGFSFAPLIMIVPISIALIWRAPISELVSQGMRHLFDSDEHEYDPNQNARQIDIVASLLKNGRHDEARQLCMELKESGEANTMVLETLLARNGIHLESDRKIKPLTEAYRLRSEGKFDEATLKLHSMLEHNPSNVDAALMLMRVYGQDLKQLDKAAEVLRALEKRPDIPKGHIEYAQRSIFEWASKRSEPVAEPKPPESIDELLACGYLGTAIEILENQTAAQPNDFDLQLKLAEVHGLHCANIGRAEKLVEQMEKSRNFRADQIRIAKTKLKEWQNAKPKQI